VDTGRLWQQRQQLLEEVRRLADEVLATADDAIERLRPPEAVAEKLAGDSPEAAPAPEGRNGHPAKPDGVPANLD
jgi:hypothetical protein